MDGFEMTQKVVDGTLEYAHVLAYIHADVPNLDRFDEKTIQGAASMVMSLYRYARTGVWPGDCGGAIIENKMDRFFMHADSSRVNAGYIIQMVLFNAFPGGWRNLHEHLKNQ